VLTGTYLKGIPSGSRATEFSYEPRRAGYVPKLTNETLEIAKWVTEESKKQGMTPSQYALNFVLLNPSKDSVVIGARTLEQIKELL
jgi:aryl-alcohol dehydrogenase-like predicted oxidoreductase